jgi:hypothetical protein
MKEAGWLAGFVHYCIYSFIHLSFYLILIAQSFPISLVEGLVQHVYKHCKYVNNLCSSTNLLWTCSLCLADIYTLCGDFCGLMKDFISLFRVFFICCLWMQSRSLHLLDHGRLIVIFFLLYAWIYYTHITVLMALCTVPIYLLVFFYVYMT